MPDREIARVTRTAHYVGRCDAPDCWTEARWTVHLTTGHRLNLCLRHKNETVTNYARASA